jgi:hypothetical protein
MPTGYTAPVEDGTITTFRDFTMLCTRAFGATIEMRDDPMDAKIVIEKIGQDNIDHHTRSLAGAKAEKDAVLLMSDEEAERRAALRYEQTRLNSEQYVRESVEKVARYQAMIAKVEAWRIPTDDHMNFKKFMLDQLHESLRYVTPSDAYTSEVVRMTGLEYRDAEFDCASDNVSYHEKALARAIENAERSRKWLTDLIDSVPATE